MSQFNGNNHTSMSPDAMGLLFLMGSWAPRIAESIEGWLKPVAFILSIILTVLAIVDYGMKIHWKVMQRRRQKEAQRIEDEKNEIDGK